MAEIQIPERPAPQASADPSIADRLERLRRQWRAFSEDPGGRLLLWRVEAEDRRMLDLFFTLEASEQFGTEDLFVRLSAPFLDAGRYGRALWEGLASWESELREALEGAELDAELAPAPALEEGEPISASTLLERARALHAHLQPLVPRLALCLGPTHVADAEAYLAWTREALEAALPHEGLRWVLAEDARAPAFGALEGEPGARVALAELDMFGAYEEISERAGRFDQPYGQYRRAYLAMGRAMREGRVEEAEARGREALEVARAEGWLPMATAIHFALGAGLLTAGRHAEAAERFALAQNAAAHAEKESPQLGAELYLKSSLARGTALFSGQRYGEAARVFEEVAGRAAAIGDVRSELEGWRLSSASHEQAKQLPQARAHAEAALSAGERLSPEERAQSTLPYVGEALLRVAAQANEGPPRAAAIEARMEGLLGPGWRALLSRYAEPIPTGELDPSLYASAFESTFEPAVEPAPEPEEGA